MLQLVLAIALFRRRAFFLPVVGHHAPLGTPVYIEHLPITALVSPSLAYQQHSVRGFS